MTPKTHKTPQLMKLLTGGSRAANPILDEEFKEEIIRAQKKPQTVKPQKAADGGTEINITSEIIHEWISKVMKRFNVCCCDRCSTEATIEAFDKIKPVIVRVRSDADLKQAQKMKADMLQEILMQLIRIIIARKSLPRHDKA